MTSSQSPTLSQSETDQELGTSVNNNNTSTNHGRRERQIPTSTSKTNLYIRGLDENTTDNDLFEMCKK